MRRRIFSIIALALFLAGLAAAQTTAVPFVIRSQQPNQTQILADNGTVSFVADSIGANTDAVISLTYRPSSLTMNLAINQVEVTGSTDFSSSNVPDLTTLQVLSSDNPGFAFHLRYKPQSSKAASGRVIVTFTEYDSAVLVNRKDRVASFSLNLNGTAPEFAYAYAVPPAGNSTLLSPDDTVVIPATNLNETSAATISLVNRGSGPGLVNSITLTGPDRFALGGVPFLPVTVDAGKSVQFTVRFTPLVLEMVSGSVNVTLSTGATLGFRVQGSGLASSYAYEILNARGAVRLTPGETVTLPEAPIGGEKTLTTIRVTNTGNADGKITAVSTAGTAFSVAEAPFLPYTLLAGKSSTVVVAFSPSQPGKSTGRLRMVRT
ncbi:MAG: choice-of-anchor D domain-containing protein [Acidobacteria bacterium]|nr:choice-of-anchor D domain-containing protein [Acidobacteriota bacterium]